MNITSLKNQKMLFCVLIILIFCSSCKSNKPYSEAMKLDLKQMYLADQNAQNYDLKKVERKEYSDSMGIEFDKLCQKNLIVVKKYFKENGYPSIKENGKEAALHFWLIVQHGDNDVTFQNKVLKSLGKEFKKDSLSYSNYYAYLYDRVKKNQNKPQLYGTQMIWDSKGIHSPYNLESPKEVNQRRKKMGLETIEEYVKGFNQ